VLDRCCDRERDGGRGQDELGDEHHGIEMGDKPVDGEVDQGALHPPCSSQAGQRRLAHLVGTPAFARSACFRGSCSDLFDATTHSIGDRPSESTSDRSWLSFSIDFDQSAYFDEIVGRNPK
jgi:hypothetical protein